MADDKKKDSGGFPAGYEAYLGFFLRELIKAGLNEGLKRLKSFDPDLNRDMIVLYTRENHRGKRMIFQAAFVSGGALVENLVDRSPIGEAFKEAAEVVLGDLPSAWGDYWERNVADIQTVPLDYLLSDERIKEMAFKFGAFLKQEAMAWWAHIPHQFRQVSLHAFFGVKRTQFYKTLIQLPEDLTKQLFALLEKLSADEQDMLLRHAELIDEFDEIRDLLGGDLEVAVSKVKLIFRKMNLPWISDHSRQQVRQSWTDLGDVVHPGLVAAADTMHNLNEDWSARLERKKREREERNAVTAPPAEAARPARFSRLKSWWASITS